MQDSNAIKATAAGQNAALQAQVPSQSETASSQTLAPQLPPTLQTSSNSGARQDTSNAEIPWVNIAEPMYKSIFRHLRSEIERGRYKEGDKLPSVRTMVADFAVSHPTVLRALEELASLGYVKLVQGSGSYVSRREFSPQPCSFKDELPAIPSAPSDAIGKQNGALSGLVNELGVFSTTKQTKNMTTATAEPDTSNCASQIPVNAWQRCVRMALQETSSSPIESPKSGGLESLKRAIAAYVRRSRGIVVDTTQVIVTPGLSVSLALINELCLCRGDLAAVEDPGSFKIRRLLAAQGAELKPIPLDSQGISIDALKELYRSAKLLHVTPNHNPTGTLMTETRRQSLLNWATYHGTLVVEDDFGGEYSLATNGQPTLFSLAQKDSVIYLGGFCGSLFPLVNTGFILIPPALIHLASKAAALRDSEQNLLEQRSLEHMLNDGHLELHLKRTKKICTEKRVQAITSLKQTLGVRVDIIGTSINGKQMLRFSEDIQTRTIVTAALRSGLPLSSASEFFIEKPHGNHFLLAHASMESKQIFERVLHFAGLLK